MKLDPIVTQMVRNNVESLIEEMEYHLFHSGYSTIIRESKDFSCALLDKRGRVTVQPALILHAPVYSEIANVLLREYPEEIKEGDVWITNHPYQAGLTHVPDVAILMPVFYKGDLVGFSSNIAHKADFGGTVPGSSFGQARELCQEGLLVPLLKYYDGGRFVSEVQRLILANVRNPKVVGGDIRSQVGVARLGAEGLTKIYERFGPSTVEAVWEELLGYSEKRLLTFLRDWENKTEEVEGFIDSDGIALDSPVRFHVAVTVKGDLITFDFRKSDPQTMGPVNLRPTLLQSCCCYALLCMTDPTILYNDGFRRPIKILTEPGTVFNSKFPAPVGSYITSVLKLNDLLLEALGRFNPKRVLAHCGGSGGTITIAWKGGTRTGSSYVQYEIFGSAYGGRNIKDGVSGTSVHTANLYITPIEIVESEFPVRVRRFELIRDSGGAGKFRGGLSFRREYQLLERGDVVKRGDRVKIQPSGIFGGGLGRAARFILHSGTAQAQEGPASGRYDLEPGDTFMIEGAGGGGYGDPLERAPEAVLRDVKENYVSLKSALNDYGVVISADHLEIDWEKTNSLRAMRHRKEERK